MNDSTALRSRWTNTPGIYCIANVRKRKLYIGRTMTLGQRLAGHLGGLRKGNHYSFDMQLDFMADPDAFAFFVLEHVPGADPLRLAFLEQWWINTVSKEFPLYNGVARVLVPSKRTRGEVLARLAELLHDS